MTIWAFYIFTPIGTIFITYLNFDPLLPFFEFILSMFPTLRKILLLFALNSETLFTFGMFVTRVVSVTVFAYEAMRIILFGISIVLVWGNVIISLLTSISSLVDRFWRKIILQGFRRHLKFYKVLMIIFHSLDEATATLALLAATIGISGCMFIAVRLHSVNESYFTGFNLFVSVNSVIWAKIILDMLGNLCMVSVKVLRHFGTIGILRRMGRHENKLYLREVKYLKFLSIPVGLGTARFSSMTQEVKSKILMFMIEQVSNLLMTF